LTFSKNGQIETVVNQLLELIKSLSNLAGNKKILVAFVGYPNTGKATILKKISEHVNGNIAKSNILTNFREV